MYKYRRVNLLSPDELHRTIKLHYQIDDQVRSKDYIILRDSVDQITNSLNLPTLTNDELISGISKFTNSYDGEYWQVQYERMDIWEHICRNNKRGNELRL